MIHIIKTKLIYTLLLCMAAGFLGAQPPGDPRTFDPKLDEFEEGSTPVVKCLDLVFTSNNNSVINLDCPEKSVFNIDVIKNNCGCENYNILIGGNRIKSVKNEGLRNLVFSKNELFLWNSFFEETGLTFLTVEIECVKLQYDPFTGATFSEPIKQRVSHPIQIVKSGQEYTAEIKHSINQPLENYCPEEIVDGPIVCCNPSAKVVITNGTATILGSSTKSILNVQAQLELNGGAATLLFPISTNKSWEDYETNETSEIDIKSITIDGKELPNGCQQFGIQAYGDIYTYQKFVADCGLPDKAIGQPWVIKVPQSFELTVCPVDADPASSCPPIKKPVVENRRNIYNRLSCTGSIDLDLEEQDELIIAWTDENGKLIDSPNGDLSNVPLGQYTVTISNKCCDVYTETFYLCDNVDKSDYTQKSDGQWCRTVTCYGEGCNEEYTECVTPDRVDDEFDQNQKKCIKKYYFNNELLGTTSVDATSETEWDEIFEECVTKYFCNGFEVFEEEYEPEESEWVYDEFWEECQRNVNCRGEEIANVSQIDAEIEWEWDDFWEECTSTFLSCDGNIINQELSVQPYLIGDWDWNSISGCVREITCVHGGENFEQQTDPVFVNTNEEGSCEEGWFEYKVYCDGQLSGFVCLANIQNPNLETRTPITSKNVRISNTSEEIIIKLKKTSNGHITIKIFDLNGRVVKDKIVDSNQEKVNILIDGVSTGIYIVDLIENGGLIHSQKVFIQN